MNKIRANKYKTILLTAMRSMLACQVVNAQEADKTGFALEEITVTATRRATSLSTTPLAVSALTNEMLERADVASMADLAAEVTGLNIIDQGAGLHRPVIRGLQGVGDAQVGIYLDNTPIAGSPGTDNSAGRFSPEIIPIDMERVEVLRGPQGTLYGGNSMGGAIRYITNKPDSTQFEGEVGAGVGTTSGALGFNTHIVLNAPIIEDKLAARLVAYSRTEEGWIDNAVTREDGVNDFEKQGARLMVGWTPTDSFKLTGTYIQEYVDAGARSIVQTDQADLTTSAPGNDGIDDDVRIFNLTAELETSFADFIYSYSDYDRILDFRFSVVTDLFGDDVNPPNYGGSILVQPQDNRSDIHEFRIVSNDEDSNFYWTVGGFRSERDTFGIADIINLDTEGNLIFPDPSGARGAREFDIPSLEFRRTVTQSQTEQAFFGEISYVLGNTTFTFGGRVFEFDNDDAGRREVREGVELDAPTLGGTTSSDGEVFKLRASHEILDDAVVYASWSQGFRAGGTNVELISRGVQDPQDTPLAFEPDQADNYEVGFRGALLDGRLTLAAAAFYIDWTDLFVDLRRSDLDEGSFTLAFRANAGEAEISGFEFEIESLVNENLTLSAGTTILSAELGSDIQSFGDSTGASAGDDLPFVPDYTFNLTAEYGWDLDDGLRAFAWGGYRYTGETFGSFSPLNPDGSENIQYTQYGDYGVFNLKFGVEADTWSSSLAIGNVGDRRECTYIRRDNNRPQPGECFVEKPRSVALQFTKQF